MRGVSWAFLPVLMRSNRGDGDFDKMESESNSNTDKVLYWAGSISVLKPRERPRSS